jgi:hypothetical protein
MLQRGAAEIADFLIEGLTMTHFKHKHVISLTGISFSPDFKPVIITEFMKNGDLRCYISDPNNVRILLYQF